MRKSYILVITSLLLTSCASPLAVERLENTPTLPVSTSESKIPEEVPTASAEGGTPTRAPKPTTETDADALHKTRETIAAGDVDLDVPGLQIKYGEFCPQKVVMGPIPPIFEEYPRAVAFPTTETNEGVRASPYLAATDITVRDVLRHALGDWYAFAIKDEQGKYIAMRVGHAREGPGLPSSLSLEGVSAAVAQSVIVQSPTQTITSAVGITCYPPTSVNIRGINGLLLRQESKSWTSDLPVNMLIWREGDMYWKLSGVELSSPYDIAYLLEIARNGLVQYDLSLKSWTEVH